MAIRRHPVIVVPLLEEKPTRHALDVAARLAAGEGARILLVAPLFVELELPLDAHFQQEEGVLRAELDRERALIEATGVHADGTIVRARHGQLGDALAAVATEAGASSIVVGATIDPHRGFRRPFSRDVSSVLHAPPCPVLVATGSTTLARAAA
jgi:nucleotide-binding universal stress UspA family protein